MATLKTDQSHTHKFIIELPFNNTLLFDGENTTNLVVKACACGGIKVVGKKWGYVCTSHENVILNTVKQKLEEKTHQKDIKLHIISIIS